MHPLPRAVARATFPFRRGRGMPRPPTPFPRSENIFRESSRRGRSTRNRGGAAVREKSRAGTAARLCANDDRLSAQLWPVQQLDRNEKRVHVHMENGGGKR